MASGRAFVIAVAAVLVAFLIGIVDGVQGANGDGLVIIVGAGVAGARAALQLKRAGRAFLILEAKDRVGGRLLTAPLGGDLGVEMGANWIHGYGSGHQLEAFAKRDDLLLTTDTDWVDRVHVKRGGVGFDPAIVAAERAEFATAYANAVASRPFVDIPIARALKRFSDWKADTVLRCALVSYNVEYEHGLPATTVSRFQVYETIDENPASYDQFVKYEGPGDLGYAAVVHKLLRNSGVADSTASGPTLRLNSPVQEIKYTAGGTEVKLNDGEVLLGSAVICTVSAAVLKRAVSTTGAGTYPKELTFDPPLPPAKLAAIAKLRMGYYTKFYLRFKHAVLTDADPLLLLPTYDCELSANVFNLNKAGFYPGSNALLVTLFSKTSEKYSRKPSVRVLRKVLRVVRDVTGKHVRRRDIAHTQHLFWNNEPYIRGAYSDHDVGFERSTFQELEKSVQGRLFFAGETVGYNDYGTVTQAWTSGRRAAKKVLEET